MTEYALFAGCLISTRYPHFEVLAKTILPELGINLIENPAFSCCPDPIQVGGADNTTWLTLAARNLAVAEEQGVSILSLCNGCTNTLAKANAQLSPNDQLREKVNGYLTGTGRNYQGKTDVKHFLHVIWDDIGLKYLKKKVKNPLINIKAATHVGCHLLSPYEIIKFDNPLDPIKLDQLVQVLGAEAIEYNVPTDCCGVSLALSGDQSGSLRAVHSKLTNIYDNGANSMIVGCPFCFQQFDLLQVRVRKQFDLSFKIQIFYYLELLGLAMGYSIEQMGLSTHKIRNHDLEAIL